MTGFAIVCLIASELNCWQLAVVFVCWLVGFVININFAKIFLSKNYLYDSFAANLCDNNDKYSFSKGH